MRLEQDEDLVGQPRVPADGALGRSVGLEEPRTSDADAGVRVHPFDHPLQGAFHDARVRIQERDYPPGRATDRLIVGGGETEVPSVTDERDGDVGTGAEPGDDVLDAVAGIVVDDENLDRQAFTVRLDRSQKLADQIGDLPIDRDDAEIGGTAHGER